jgi:hypothetical protein
LRSSTATSCIRTWSARLTGWHQRWVHASSGVTMGQ